MTKNSGAKTQKHESVDVKKKLEQVAFDLFSTRGYDGTSVADIVDAAGVTKPMMYYYYGDKEHLHAHVLRQAAAALAEPTQPYASTSVDALETLVSLAENLAAFYLKSPQATRIAYQLAISGKSFEDSPDIRADFEKHRDKIEAVIASGIKTRQLSDSAKGLASVILSMVYMEVLMRLGPDGDTRQKSLLKSLPGLLKPFKT